MKFLIPLGGRAFKQEGLDSWVLTEYRILQEANNAICGVGVVAGNKFDFHDIA